MLDLISKMCITPQHICPDMSLQFEGGEDFNYEENLLC